MGQDDSNAGNSSHKEGRLNAVEFPNQHLPQASLIINAQDYDDPQPGPSGIKQEVHRNAADYHQDRCYTNAASSSDDDSDDDREIMQTTTLWSSSGKFNLNQTSRPNLNRDLDEDSLTNGTSSSAAAAAAVATADVNVDFNRNVGSPRPEINRIVASLRSDINRTTSEILTAPDLQLDWLSDSSDGSETATPPADVTATMHVIPKTTSKLRVISEMTSKMQVKWHPSSSPVIDAADVKAESEPTAATNDATLQIDLTTSDDDDIMEINVFNGATETRSSRSPRLPASPDRVPHAMNCLQQGVYDDYHKRESHVGHLNCRSAYSTCDCLEAAR